MVQLNEILKNSTVLSILQFFIQKPSINITQTEIIKRVDIAKATAVKWVKYLVNLDILKYDKIGVSHIYTLNNENIVVKQLKITNTIIQLTELNKMTDMEIYLYGSASRGEDTEKSDIDLLILGKVRRNEIINPIDSLSKKIDRKINFNIFDNLEWSMMEKKDKAYYNRVEKDKIRII